MNTSEFHDVEMFRCGMTLLRWIEGRPAICENFPAMKEDLLGLAWTFIDRALYAGTGHVCRCRRNAEVGS